MIEDFTKHGSELWSEDDLWPSTVLWAWKMSHSTAVCQESSLWHWRHSRLNFSKQRVRKIKRLKWELIAQRLSERPIWKAPETPCHGTDARKTHTHTQTSLLLPSLVKASFCFNLKIQPWMYQSNYQPLIMTRICFLYVVGDTALSNLWICTKW